MTVDDPEQGTEELDLILSIAVRKFLAGDSFDQILHWFVDAAPDLAPGLIRPVEGDPEGLRALALQIARLVWTRTPDPALGFRTRRLAKPERNRPCPCGSGRKYKQCCQNLPSMTDNLGQFSLLPYVLDQYSRADLKQLPFQRLSPEELAHVADTWEKQGRLKDAAALLEAYFTHATRLDRRSEWPFDLLMGLYLELNHPVKRKRLLQRVLNAPDKVLRAAGLHKECTILADEGKYDQAWRVFRESQRMDPDNPALSHLEVILLMSEGRQQQAAERARFWIARFRRMANPELDGLIDFLNQFAGDPNATMLSMGTPEGHAMKQLGALLQQLPPPDSLYTLEPEGDDAGPLEPVPALADAIEGWRNCLAGVSDPQVDTGWLGWLQRNPQALNSFEILRDLHAFIEDSSLLEPVAASLQSKVLERAVQLLRRVIEANAAGDFRLQWGWLQNRAALWLVGELAIRLLDEDPKRSVELLTWLVDKLNPDDNQGLRGPLLHLYVKTGDQERALALAERYPEDFAEMRYGKVLALYAAGQRGRALNALADAYRQYPKVLRTLAARNPRPPAMNQFGITVGGDDEAWLYRQDHLVLWQSTGALEWARAARKSLR